MVLQVEREATKETGSRNLIYTLGAQEHIPTSHHTFPCLPLYVTISFVPGWPLVGDGEEEDLPIYCQYHGSPQ